MAPTGPLGDQRPIVGREREREQLRACFEQALAGHGKLVLLSGEAGIGKTTLVRDLIRQAEEYGALVMSGGCYDLTTTPLYGPWDDALRDHPRGAEQAPVPAWFSNSGEARIAVSQAALFGDVSQYFAAISEQQPLMIVLEDLHWADPASLELLRYVTRAIDDKRLLLVVTYRRDELVRENVLYRLLPALIREAPATRIDLRRLDADAVNDLITAQYALSGADHDRLVDHIQRLAEGNPFFATELLRTLEEEGVLRPPAEGDSDAWSLDDLRGMQVPSLVLHVIERRLSHLRDETRDALETAAIIGQRVPIDLWQLTSGLSEDALDDAISQALTAHVLQETPDAAGLQFTHALVREALHEGIILTRRRTRHRLVGETLAALAHPEPDVVAYHFQQAGDDRAIEWLARAGLRAWHSSAWISAAERFEAAATLLDGDASRARECGWLLYMAATLLRFTDNRQTLALLQRAERLAAMSGDDVLAANVIWHRGITRCQLGDMRRGLLDIGQGDAALDRLGHEQFVLSEEDLGAQVVRSLVPGSDDRDNDNETVSPAGRPSPALIQRGVLINHLGLAGHYRHALELGEAWVATMHREFGREHLRNINTFGGHLGLGRAYARLGRPAEALEQMHLARAAALEMGDSFGVSYCILIELQHVIIPYFADDVRRRAQLVNQAMEDADHLKLVMEGVTHDRLCKLVVDLIDGRWAEVDAPELDVAHIAHQPMIAKARLIHGVLARHRGQFDRAWEQVGELLPDGQATVPGDGQFTHANAGQRLAVDLALDAGDLELARVWLDAHASWLAWSGAVLGRAEGEVLWARYYQEAGDRGKARERANQALEHASDPRQPLALTAADRMLGELDIQDKRYAEADAHLRQSLTLAQACAAPFEQALTLLAFADLGAAAGKDEEARSMLAQAREICEPLDAKPALARVHEIERRLDQARKATSFPAGLSPREVDVLRLVVQGLTDAEIAEQLFLSPRTVSSYLSSVYNKLGVSSRTAAAGFAIREGIA